MRKLQSWVYGTVGFVLLNASTGCVNINALSPDGNSINYTRFLVNQEISGFKIIKDKDGTYRIEFDTQKSTEMKTLSDVAGAIKNISEKLPKIP